VNDDLRTKVESMKAMLVSYATGGGNGFDGGDYRNLRHELISLPRIAKSLPRFVHNCRDFSEFRGFIKSKFSTYAERREYLRSEFDPLLTMLETESHTLGDAAITATVQAVSSTYVREAWRARRQARLSWSSGCGRHCRG